MNHLRSFVALGVLSAILSVGVPDAAAADSDPATAPPMPSVVMITQAEDGSILLHSRDAEIHGTTARYEPQQHKNTIAFWTNQDDWVSWTFTATKPGTFTVEVLQGCGKGSGGAEVALTLSEQNLSFTVEDTGHFQNFVKRCVGQLKIAEAGTFTLSVKPKSKPGVAVMDLRQVLLRPMK
jgi:arylsulfatase A